MPSITFLGAARTVTGSKYLLDTGSAKVLVDAGLFQGLKELRERNWQDLPIAASAIDAIVLTHAHLDHCGYLPRLVVAGLPRPRVLHAPARRISAASCCRTAGRIQEEDAANANRHGYSKHAPALPLYTEADAFRAVSQLQPVRLRPADAGRARTSRSSSSTRATCSARRTCACAPAAGRSSSAAISAASAVPCCRIRRWSTRRTTCSSNPPTAIACTRQDDDGAKLAEVDRRRRPRAAAA